jgi:hypothetical protein
MNILIFILFLVAVAIGTSLPFWVGLLVLAFFIYNSSRAEGLEALLPMALSVVVALGLIIGNISYAVQTDYFKDASIPNPFVVNKK